MVSLHSWDLSPAEAIRLQLELRERVVIQPLRLDDVRYMAGVDCAFLETAGGGMARAAAVLLDYHSLELIEAATAELPLKFPYIPGLLSFREAPVILAALQGLEAPLDVILCDGHGLAHPRRFGLACHLGVWLDQAVVGCAKSILVGQHETPGTGAGSRADILDGLETVGVALRTRRGVKPVYVSVGHRVDLLSAVGLVQACVRDHRLPEPTRLAHRLASRRLDIPAR